jgi:hypothetical protein
MRSGPPGDALRAIGESLVAVTEQDRVDGVGVAVLPSLSDQGGYQLAMKG